MLQKYWVFSTITVLLWGSSSVLIRMTFGSFSALTLTSTRTWIAAVTLLVICVIKKLPPPRLRDIPIFLLAGAAGIVLQTIFFNLGFELVTAATGNVILASCPIFTAVIARFLFKERIRPLGWVFTGVSFVGILILVLWGGVLSINIGVLWVLISAICLAVYNLTQRQLTTTRYSAISSSAYSMIAAALLISPLLPSTIFDIAAAPPSALVVAFYLGAGGSAVAFLAWTKAFSLAKRTADVANFLYLPPFIATIIAFAVFRELPDWGTVLGGVVILFGLWMFQKKA